MNCDSSSVNGLPVVEYVMRARPKTIDIPLAEMSRAVQRASHLNADLHRAFCREIPNTGQH